MFRFGLTIFWSAFLLFQVQPLIGKRILPWFGGTPVVWTTCMLFFQVFLLGGYAYAHFLTKVSRRKQAVIHTGIMMVSLAIAAVKYWVLPKDFMKPEGSENPILQILLLLSVYIGAPYFILSSTAPLLQHWFSGNHPGRSPYRLYALSNVGSLLALLSYPLYFEPKLTLAQQNDIWMAAYCGFVVICTLVAHSYRDTAEDPDAIARKSPTLLSAYGAEEVVMPTIGDRFLWILLPMCGSMLLLSTTNQLSQDVAVIPFLWVLPLALYLISFILCFDSDIWYWRPVWGMTLVVSYIGVGWLLGLGVNGEMTFQLIGYPMAMFAGCMVCHGELARLKPHPKFLTGFYLSLSIGGALGGLFVTLASTPFFHTIATPVFELLVKAFRESIGRVWMPEFLDKLVTTSVFETYWEYDFSLIFCAILYAACLRTANPHLGYKKVSDWVWGPYMLAMGLFIGIMGARLKDESDRVVYTTRNFFGVLQVSESDKGSETWHRYSLNHGRILHGMQFRNPSKRLLKTTYYSENSGIGVACRFHPNRIDSPNNTDIMKIGVVGLGTGSSAAWGEKGDIITFYDINPAVVNMPEKYFSYRTDTPAQCITVLGDARIKMEQQAAKDDLRDFDVLVIDAFSGDSIPVHLLTKECMELYIKHMHKDAVTKDVDGIIAFHISNRYIDLAPVVKALANEFKLEAVYIDSDDNDDDKGESQSTWILVTNNSEFLSNRKQFEAEWPAHRKLSVEMLKRPDSILWTDDYSNLIGLIKWGDKSEQLIDRMGIKVRQWFNLPMETEEDKKAEKKK